MQEALIQHGLHVVVYQQQSTVPQDVAETIVQSSRQEHIRATTPDDEAIRFTDVAAFYSWFRQGKFLVALVATQVLRGLVSEQTRTYWARITHMRTDYTVDTQGRVYRCLLHKKHMHKQKSTSGEVLIGYLLRVLT